MYLFIIVDWRALYYNNKTVWNIMVAKDKLQLFGSKHYRESYDRGA